MKRKVKCLISAAALITAAASVTAFAKQNQEMINVAYENIKILLDGAEYTPKDVNGNTVEPFIYNGTTYLPVRAVANAFGKDVDWDSQTSTVVLGSKKYDWLDQIGYATYETTGNENTLKAWPSGDNAEDGTKYDHGLLLKLGYVTAQGGTINDDGSLSSYQNVEYLLNNNYKSLKGKLVLYNKNDVLNEQTALIKIYGDGNLLYTSPPLSTGANAVDIDVDVSNYKVLKINASLPNGVAYSSNSKRYCSVIGIVDARLERAN